jgi:hypothetical protein
MVPRDEVLAWRSMAPWAAENDVEQDLIITRAVFDIFEDPWLAERFDLWWAMTHHTLDLNLVAANFRRYMGAEGSETPSAVQFRRNLDAKAVAGVFDEVRPLLRTDVAYDATEALAWFEEYFLPLVE